MLILFIEGIDIYLPNEVPIALGNDLKSVSMHLKQFNGGNNIYHDCSFLLQLEDFIQLRDAHKYFTKLNLQTPIVQVPLLDIYNT